MIGNIIGSYKIVEKIGEGGMGAVYKGIDFMLNREVALKAIRPELARQPEIVERFRTEAITLAKLNHPNIATLYNFLRQGDDYFMVMEFVNGEGLDSILRTLGQPSVGMALALFCQALKGIDHAHKMGVIHRDIKPANIMLTQSRSIKVMDFGIARVLGAARMTRQGSVVGTIEYMSPEQIQGLATDQRSDIYSLGILLFEMLTGRLPFISDNDYQLMRLQVESLPPSPRDLVNHIPPEVEEAIMKALAKSPENRFQTVNELGEALLGARFRHGDISFRTVRQNELEMAINSIGAAISSTMEIEPILQSAVEEVGRAMRVRRAAIDLWSEQSEVTEALSIYERDGPDASSRGSQPGELRSMIKHREDPIGILIVEDDTPERTWQSEEIEMLRKVSEQLATAITHARAFQKVQLEAMTDSTTGLYNERSIKERLEKEIELANRNGDSLSLLLASVDYFYRIRDGMGRQRADDTLRHVGNIIRQLFREVDICARYSGEEFMIVIPQCSREDGKSVAERLREAIASTPLENVGQVTVSIGVSTYPLPAKCSQELIEQADRAMYLAMAAGRNRVRTLPFRPNPEQATK